MNFDFESLAEKVNQLAELSITLRKENNVLRIRNAELISEQNRMKERLQEARERIEVLINRLPVVDDEQVRESNHDPR